MDSCSYFKLLKLINLIAVYATLLTYSTRRDASLYTFFIYIETPLLYNANSINADSV